MRTLQVARNLEPPRLLDDVLAEVEGGADGETGGPTAVLQEIAEEVIPDQVSLNAHGDMAGEEVIHTPAESAESAPIGAA